MDQGRRRSAKLDERITHCTCCNHFLSHRHHLLPFAEYGENDITIQLCANCHEIYHLLEKVYAQHRENKAEFDKLVYSPKTKSMKTYVAIIYNLDNKRCKFFSDLIDGVEALKCYIEDDGSVLEENREDVTECIQDLSDTIRQWIEKSSRKEDNADKPPFATLPV